MPSRTIGALTAALVAGAGLTASSGAQAFPFKPFPKLGGYHHHWHPGFGIGAGVLGGLALAAATTSAYGGDCYLARRVVSDEYGNTFVRRVRVCE